MKKKTALITGITGQDGYYLARFLLEKNYTVHGTYEHTYAQAHNIEILALLQQFPVKLYHSDIADAGETRDLIQKIAPDEIYNLAAQSHVQVSFERPILTAQIDALGALHVLEAIRSSGLREKTRFYQAGTSELFGNAGPTQQNEATPFAPCSPYATAKLYAHWTVVNYRQAFGLFACNGILFNHESPLRGMDFVTRKITSAVARIVHGLQDVLYLGNLDARRDWGHARDYVLGIWRILQQSEAEDFVLATGRAESVREFTQKAFMYADIDLTWEGQGPDEVGRDARTGMVRIATDPKFFRPQDIGCLQGDPSKAVQKLDWNPARTSLDALIEEMVEADLERVKKARKAA